MKLIVELLQFIDRILEADLKSIWSTICGKVSVVRAIETMKLEKSEAMR